MSKVKTSSTYAGEEPVAITYIDRNGPFNPYQQLTLSAEELNFLGSRLEGKLLTILEAAITDKTQLEALKSITRSAIYESLGKITYLVKDEGVDSTNGYKHVRYISN